MLTSVEGLIVILGSPNSDQGELYSIAKERCELALAEYAKRTHWKILVTGGYGAHFNTTDRPHAEYLKHYLVNRGVPGQEIVEYAISTNTLEDASMSKAIILKYQVQEIMVVTSDYHIDRARYIFEREFSNTGIRIHFLASQTNEKTCEFNLVVQRKHEREALEKLKKMDYKKLSEEWIDLAKDGLPSQGQVLHQSLCISVSINSSARLTRSMNSARYPRVSGPLAPSASFRMDSKLESPLNSEPRSSMANSATVAENRKLSEVL